MRVYIHKFIPSNFIYLFKDFEFVAKRRPNDRDAAMKYSECNKLVRKQAFEKAISSDVPEKTLAEIHSDLESIGMCTVGCSPFL